VVAPVYNTRHAGDTLIRLAKQIGGDVGAAFPWKKYEEALKIRAKGLFDSDPGMVSYDGSSPVWQRMTGQGSVRPDYDDFDDLWKKLKSAGLWYRPSHGYGNWGSLFHTPSGKFEFLSTRIEQAVYDFARAKSKDAALEEMGIYARGQMVFMPHFEAPWSEEDLSEYPLRMVPYELINVASGWIPTPPHLNKTIFDSQLRKDESFAEINPDTATEHGLKDGDRVIIESAEGEVKVRVSLFEGAMPGCIYMPLGFGHTAYDEFLREKGVNPNEIIHSVKDPLSGHPIWWNTPVRLIKV
jgi:anaerobic selenocysteine-containing dehydrogenase